MTVIACDFEHAEKTGTLVFDNLLSSRQAGGSSSPIKGCTTGRNWRGQFNGTLCLDDLRVMQQQLIEQGCLEEDFVLLVKIPKISDQEDRIKVNAVMRGFLPEHLAGSKDSVVARHVILVNPVLVFVKQDGSYETMTVRERDRRYLESKDQVGSGIDGSYTNLRYAESNPNAE